MPKDLISHLSQDELIQAIAENKREVMTAIYLEVFPKVKNYVIQNSGEEEEAKDIFQEAFVVVWQKVKSGDFIPLNATALQGFLFQIAKNKWLDWLRSSKFKKVSSMGAMVIEVSEEVEEDQEERLSDLDRAFRELGENCRDLLKSFYFQKMSLTELAQKFGWTAQTAKNNKYRCMETLRKIIKK
ncbi:RNA polymerase sigma factor [Algoriphagus namhaensis]